MKRQKKQWTDFINSTTLSPSQGVGLLISANEDLFQLMTTLQDMALTNAQYATEVGHIVNESTENEDYLNSAYKTYLDIWVGAILAANDFSKEKIAEVQENLSTYVQNMDSAFESMAKEQQPLLDTLLGFTNGQVTDLKNLTTAERDQLIKMAESIPAEMREALGISIDAIYNASSQANEAWRKKSSWGYQGSLDYWAQQATFPMDSIFFGEGGSNRVRYNQLDPLFQVIKDVFAKGGTEASKALGEILDHIETSEQLQAFLDLINNINLDTPISSFENLGISFDNLATDAQVLINTLGDIDLLNFDTTAANYKVVKDIIDGLSYNSTLKVNDKTDEYQILKDFGLPMEQFFELTNTGEYRLIQKTAP